jgi:transcriptional regulator
VDNVFKLSQDRDAKSYHSIIATLKEQGENGQVVAAVMERRMKQEPGDRG